MVQTRSTARRITRGNVTPFKSEQTLPAAELSQDQTFEERSKPDKAVRLLPLDNAACIQRSDCVVSHAMSRCILHIPSQ